MKYYLNSENKINVSINDLPDGVVEVTFDRGITPSDYNNALDADKYIIEDNVVKHQPLTPQEIAQHKAQEAQEDIYELERQFENFKQTPIIYPLNGKSYKPVWADDGTYIKIIVAMQIAAQMGVENPIQLIWDSTGLTQNAVEMKLEDIIQLTAWLRSVAEPAYLDMKNKKAELLKENKDCASSAQ